MLKFNLGLLVLALALCCVTGCGPGREVSLSPDGKTVAMTDKDQLLLHDTSGHRPDVHINLEAVASPLFSPDSKSILVSTRSRTLLIDRVTRHQTNLPDLSPPFAWKPDSTEVVGMEGKNATVIHIPSRSIVRRYVLPEQPYLATWIGAGRDMAFSSDRTLYEVQQGKVLSHKITGQFSTLGYDETKNRILWSERTEIKPKNSLPTGRIAVKEIDLGLTTEERILSEVDYAKFTSHFGKTTGPVSVSVSPTGALAVTLIVDESPPGVMAKYASLGGFGGGDISDTRKRRLRLIEKQMRFRYVSTAGQIPSYVFSPVDFRFEGQLPLLSGWSQDGRTVAVSVGDKVYIEHPGSP